jgi:hypothetical protein
MLANGLCWAKSSYAHVMTGTVSDDDDMWGHRFDLPEAPPPRSMFSNASSDGLGCIALFLCANARLCPSFIKMVF